VRPDFSISAAARREAQNEKMPDNISFGFRGLWPAHNIGKQRSGSAAAGLRAGESPGTTARVLGYIDLRKRLAVLEAGSAEEATAGNTAAARNVGTVTFGFSFAGEARMPTRSPDRLRHFRIGGGEVFRETRVSS